MVVGQVVVVMDAHGAPVSLAGEQVYAVAGRKGGLDTAGTALHSVGIGMIE